MVQKPSIRPALLCFVISIFITNFGISLDSSASLFVYIFALVFLVAGIQELVYAITTKLTITNYGVDIRIGLIRKNETSIPFNQITNVVLTRGLVQMLLGVQRLEISRSTTTGRSRTGKSEYRSEYSTIAGKVSSLTKADVPYRMVQEMISR